MLIDGIEIKDEMIAPEPIGAKIGFSIVFTICTLLIMAVLVWCYWFQAYEWAKDILETIMPHSAPEVVVTRVI